jgi:hypothetical protein
MKHNPGVARALFHFSNDSMYNDLSLHGWMAKALSLRSSICGLPYELLPKRRDITQPYLGTGALHHAPVKHRPLTWR